MKLEDLMLSRHPAEDYFLTQVTCILALPDYVSRAHEIEIRPSSVVRPSSVRLWDRLSLKLLHGFLSNLSCAFPWAICSDVFSLLKTIFDFFTKYYFFRFR